MHALTLVFRNHTEYQNLYILQVFNFYLQYIKFLEQLEPPGTSSCHRNGALAFPSPHKIFIDNFFLEFDLFSLFTIKKNLTEEI